jgi:hypothetical protein
LKNKVDIKDEVVEVEFLEEKFFKLVPFLHLFNYKIS